MSVSRVEGRDRRRLLRGSQGGLVDIALVEDGLRPQADRGGRDDLGDALVGLLVETDLTRRGQIGGNLDDHVDLAVRERGVGRRRVRIGRDRDVLVELLRGRLDGRLEGRRGRFHEADLGRLVLTEQDRRDEEGADDDGGRERHTEDEAAAAAALEDLAPSDQPDASPAGHHATSWAGSGETASMNSSDSLGGW